VKRKERNCGPAGPPGVRWWRGGRLDGGRGDTTTTVSGGEERLEVLTGSTYGELADVTLVYGEEGVGQYAQLVGDDATQYVQTSAFVSRQLPDQARPLEELLADDWARVDLGEFEYGLAGITAAVSSQAATIGPPTPEPLFEALSAPGDVEDLGGDQVDGEPMTGYSVEVRSNELHPALGMVPLLEEGQEDALAAAGTVTVPVEAGVDEAGSSG
jgi:hypothetical protein